MTFSADLRIGEELLGYRIESALGRGGMSVVYLAEDIRLRRRVALKFLAPRLAEDAAFRERFLRESELAASLDHPNVVPIYAAGEDGNALYIAMRYVEGRDLKELLRAGPLDARRAIHICGQVANALDFAHAHRLVHRDVKPSNVLLDLNDHVYLADFGLTRRTDGTQTLEPGLFGTIDYIAPEQIRGEDVDGRADVYALGCLLYECLTGTAPFLRASDAATLYAHLEEEAPTLPGLEHVLKKALAKAPADRYATCGEFIADARQALGFAAPRRNRLPFAIALSGIAVIAAGLLAVLVTLEELAARDGGGPPAPDRHPLQSGRRHPVPSARGRSPSPRAAGACGSRRTATARCGNSTRRPTSSRRSPPSGAHST